MNLEGITLHCLSEYLNDKLLNSKIVKISMPNKNGVLFVLRKNNSTYTLFANMNGDSPVLYIPNDIPKNLDIPPAFCMLLRKHLENGRISKINQVDLDRIIEFEIDLLGNNNKIITKKLIFELTGKNSNLLLLENNIIIDSLKHINITQNSFRSIKPLAEYIAPPPQNGVPILEKNADVILESFRHQDIKSPVNMLVSATTGIGKDSAKQLLFEENLDLQEENTLEKSFTHLKNSLPKIQNDIINNNKFTVVISKQNRCKTIFPYTIFYHEPNFTYQVFTDLNEAINFAVSLNPIQLEDQELLKKLSTNEIVRLEKKLQVLNTDLTKANNAETERIIADTLMANLYQIKTGVSSCELINIYDNTPITIALSPLLSPNENAQNYYKKYNKYKRAQKEVVQQLEETADAIEYLKTIENSLDTASTKEEITEIKQELVDFGLVAPLNKKKAASSQKSTPLHIKFSNNTSIFIGKNNKQNDYVTFSLAAKNDLWFHVKDIPGSHVVVKTSLNAPESEAIDAAIHLAAHFSKASTGSNVPVDCTERKYVKKPSGSKPGFVIYTNQKTYYATPEQTEIQKLLLLQ